MREAWRFGPELELEVSQRSRLRPNLKKQFVSMSTSLHLDAR